VSAETSTAGELSLEETAARAKAILDEIERAVIGKRPVLELVLGGLLADGHLLLDDLPGVAKTLTARSLATVTGLAFHRIQFTPDLLPADITGAVVLDRDTGGFAFRPGPVFANLVLADEVNRAPAKTQAALLEAMQEGQVTADGTTHRLPRPFLVVATQNPIEYEGTYPLPEAQLDRFLLRTTVGYPSHEDEWHLVDRRLQRGTDEVELAPVATAADVLAMQRALERVHVAEPVGRYAVAIVTATREEPQLQVGASPRGSLALVKLARAHALLQGRDFVTPDDVKDMARPALAHRLVLRSELWVRRVAAEDVLAGVLDGVPAPTWH
jgi:MoxR-like ATPase